MFLLFYFATVAYLLHMISRTPTLQNSFMDIWLRLYQIYIFLFGSLAAIGFIQFYHHPFVIKNRAALAIAAKSVLLLAGMSLIFSYELHESTLKTLLYPSLFALLLLLLSLSDLTISWLNNKAILFAGKRSFGIYMLHPIAIVMCVKWLPGLHSGNIFTDTFLFDVIALILTILLAAGIYAYIEKPFFA